MRSKIIVVVLALCTALALVAATPAKKVKPNGAKKSATRASAAKASQSKGTTAAGHTAGKKAAGGKKSSAKQTSSARFRRSTQREPAPERYKEIQQSLAEKGYFTGPVNGAWGTDSVEALKRFQRDQNIGDDGKLGSLSLIALGLGPKRGASGDAKPETPASAPPLP
ncbi:MAG: Peptidoglycan-binding domain 1 protein [Bryobacterales bacterium]|nr:Peptidoglycan-binding domain 1 protein [Bryobacterales bacterium]